MILTNFKVFVKLYKHNDISSKLSKFILYNIKFILIYTVSVSQLKKSKAKLHYFLNYIL